MEKKRIIIVTGWMLLIILFELLSLYLQDQGEELLAKLFAIAMLVVMLVGAYLLAKSDVELPQIRNEKARSILMALLIILAISLGFTEGDRIYAIAGILIVLSLILGRFESSLLDSLSSIFGMIGVALIDFQWITAREYVAKIMGLFTIGIVGIASGVLLYVTIKEAQIWKSRES
ncbi:hypothetical protein [Thermococcus sp. LS2]|uniref:hypothetical protein n=1 Tax=Thermococcus sp. LS2 TaxID=1638260 RepID=UPI00143C69E0|nr:hypothetical protein [Thermococcus sp. LS2]NJE12951.1 hypothetical protein [Thermococcus sp. LS2]